MTGEQLSTINGAVATAAVRTVDLTLGFGAKTVLGRVSLQFPERSITALLGPTGSGKSTYLRALNRLNDRVSGYRYSGDVLVGGHSIFSGHHDLMELRRQMGMLFQRPNPFPMSIADNVLAGVRAHKLAPREEFKNIAERLMTKVGLWEAVKDRLDDSPFRLSGGQQQLLCLARALAVNPEVLLLDEPTSALDPAATEKVEDLIRLLAKRLTVIVVTHNLAQARRLADRVAFFFDGELVEAGLTGQVFENPRREQTLRYVSGRFG
jgi:phosphate transport system ATP-binding protein